MDQTQIQGPEAKQGRVAFLSGNQAVAHAVALAGPGVIAAYPITPQTTVVEELALMDGQGELSGTFIQVESEHSALALVMASAMTGLRTFTATSSQGLLYMAEVLNYVAGARLPVVMMNANRALALPWNIYGDQSDSLSQISSGWIQVYARTAQEALDLTLMAYALGEDPSVRLPVMVNLDGFYLTHTYEAVDIPGSGGVDLFLGPPEFPSGYPGTIDFDHPRSLAVTAGPLDYARVKALQERAMEAALERWPQVAERFLRTFGRAGPELIRTRGITGAQRILVTLGTLAGSLEALAQELAGFGVLSLTMIRPFPARQIVELIETQAGPGELRIGVLEKDVSSGHQGSLALELKAAFHDWGRKVNPSLVRGFVLGLGGEAVDASQIRGALAVLDGQAPESQGYSVLGGVCHWYGPQNQEDEHGKA